MPQIPGWKLVPEEPTVEMKIAGDHAGFWCGDKYRAMLAAAPVAPIPEDVARNRSHPCWMPIETAPKDGTEVLAFNGEYALMHWIEGKGYALWEYSDRVLSEVCPEPEQPSHWMHLPSGPQPTLQEPRHDSR